MLLASDAAQESFFGVGRLVAGWQLRVRGSRGSLIELVALGYILVFGSRHSVLLIAEVNSVRCDVMQCARLACGVVVGKRMS